MSLFLLLAVIFMFLSAFFDSVKVGKQSVDLFKLAWAFALLSVLWEVKL